MTELNPLVLAGAIIGTVSVLLILAYAMVKDKKTSMGFERNISDGEIVRRLAHYARPYLGSFVVAGLLMLFSIVYDIVSPLIVGAVEEMLVQDFSLNAPLWHGGRLCGHPGFLDGQLLFSGGDPPEGGPADYLGSAGRSVHPHRIPGPSAAQRDPGGQACDPWSPMTPTPSR